MYTLKRSEKVIEEFRLPNDEKIKVTIDIDVIASEFISKRDSLLRAQKCLKAVQRAGSRKEFPDVYAAYGAALIDFFAVMFGKENTCKILESYDNNYIEMFIEVVPFIEERINPAILRAVEASKKRIRALGKGSKNR